MIKIQKKIFSVFVLILLFSSLSVYSQNKFPEGSAQGRTEMTGNVRMPDVPNVNISITEPKTGEEVAFSVRLLLLIYCILQKLFPIQIDIMGKMKPM